MVSRPRLPVQHANPKVKELLLFPNPPPVKYQILNCQGKDILVGRLKIETHTDTGHAFILRRYDTGAVSLTTMFRAAFPTAPDLDEKAEIQWVRDSYDLSGNNGSTKDTAITRLAGTWVSPQVALELGKEYSLGHLIKAVVDASPDPNGNYRRSGRAAAVPPPPVYNVAKSSPAENFAVPASVIVTETVPASKSLPTPSPTSTNPPAKRRKESSPAPAPASASESSKPPSRSSPAPSKIATPRRSTRTKSPAPRSSATIAPLTSVIRTPKTTRSSAKKEAAAAAVPSTSLAALDSELTAVEEENQLVEDGLAGTELHEEDVREQQKLIEDLKRERDAMKLASVADEPMEVTEESSKKREREEEETLKFEFKEPEAEERVIATNSRVGRFHLEPRTKSFAWGVAAFAVGMGAVFLPGLF